MYNHDFKTLIIVTFFRLETALVGEIMGSSRLMEDPGTGSLTITKAEPLSALFLQEAWPAADQAFGMSLLSCSKNIP